MTNKVYVAMEDAGAVFVFDPVSGDTTSVLVQSAPDAIAVNPITNRIYVANQSSASVSVLDGMTNAVVGTIAVGSNPYALAVNPVTNRIYVANRLGNSVSVIEGASNTVAQTIGVGSDPRSLCVNPLTNRIYVANRGSASVTVINGSNGTTSAVTVGSAPMAIAVNPTTNYVYVANQGSANVTRIDGATLAKVTIAAGSNPYAIGIDPVANRIYVANVAGSSVTVINGATNSRTTVAAGTNPVSVTVNPSTGRAYVCNQSSTWLTIVDGATSTAQSLTIGSSGLSGAVNAWTGKVYVARNITSGVGLVEIDATTNTVTSAAAGGSPGAVAVNRRTHRGYLANQTGNTVTEVDLATLAPVATIAVGAGPKAVLVDEFRNRIYTANFASGTVSLIDGATRGVTSIAVGMGPQALALDAKANRIYVANDGDNSVTIIDGVALGTIAVPLGADARPAAIAVNPVTRDCYVANRGNGTVTRIQANGAIVRSVGVGTSPTAILVDALANRLYVANSGSNSVTVLDGVSDGPTSVPVGNGPVALALDAVRGRVFSADSAASTITSISTLDLSTVSIPTVAQPVAVVVNPWSSRLYVGGLGTSALAVVDLGGLVSNSISLTGAASALAVDEILGVAVGAQPVLNACALVREAAEAILPLTSATTSLPSDEATHGGQAFSGTSSSTRSPNNAGILAQWIVIDSPLRGWQAANLTTGAGTPNVTWQVANADPGNPGAHVIYAAALDATSATLDNSSQGNASVFIGARGPYVYRTGDSSPDRAPTVNAPATWAGVEGVELQFTVSASDPDGDPMASLTASGTAISAGGVFTVAAGNSSGTFAWTPAYGLAGSYSVTFTAANALTGWATTSLAVAPPPEEGRTIEGTVTATVVDWPFTTTPSLQPLPQVSVEVIRDGLSIASGVTDEDSGAFSFQATVRASDSIAVFLDNPRMSVSDKSHTSLDPCSAAPEHIGFGVLGTQSHFELIVPTGTEGTSGQATNLVYLTERMTRDYWQQVIGVPDQQWAYLYAQTNWTSSNAQTGFCNSSSFRQQYQITYPYYRSGVAHEFTHRVIIQAVGHPMYDGQSTSEFNVQAKPMDEALADYFAASYDNDPRIHPKGPSLNPNPGASLRDISKVRRMVTCLEDYNNDDRAKMYWHSVVLSGALWDWRSKLVAQYSVDPGVVDRAVFEVLPGIGALNPENRTFYSFLTALRTTVLGMQYRSDLDQVFLAHNIGDQPEGNCPLSTILWVIENRIVNALRRITVSWHAVPSAGGYRVYMTRGAGLGVGPGEVVADSLSDTTFVYSDPDTASTLSLVVAPILQSGDEGLPSHAVSVVTSVDAGPEVPHDITWRLFPTPSTDGVRFQVSGDLREVRAIRVFDVQGRLVHEVAWTTGLSQGVVLWDGKGRDGHRVATGVYFARLETTRRIFTKKMTIVR